MKRAYPLGDRSNIRTCTGKPLADITLEQIRAENLHPEDLVIRPDILREQALIAEEHGFQQFAANLRRAAELTLLPEATILAIYEALRPYRTSAERLDSLVDELEQRWQAPETARLVREAAAEYRRQKLI